MLGVRRFSLISIAVIMCAVCAWAHNGTFDDVQVDTWTGIPSLVHYETIDNPDSEFKGWAYFIVKNTMDEAWTDFHIQINSWASVNSVYIGDATMSWSDYTVSYSNYNSYGPREADFLFNSTPVQPNQTVTFAIYTDNTTNNNEWFGFCLYPTPEPATLAILGLGATFMMEIGR